VSKESEIITLSYQGITVNSMVAVIKQAGKDPPVPPQQCMNIPNIVVLVTVKTVVVIVATLVGAEFFIRPSEKFSSAVKTYSFHSVMF
jgi:hypothetical protein